MPVVGIIAEYNPFHCGHLRQICEIRSRMKDAYIIAAMSGHFTQRGGIAVLDKWTRASLAVLNGIDLALELPAVFALRSAQYFASAGVRLLDRLGVVDKLAFGSECPDISVLSDLANRSLEAETELREQIRAGASYAAALEFILTGKNESESVMRQPNNILAIEYIKAIKQYKAAIEPIALLRDAEHKSLGFSGGAASSSAIREAMRKNEFDKIATFVPNSVFEELTSRQIPDEEFLFRPLLSRLITSDKEAMRKIYGVSEGFENRLFSSAFSCRSWECLVKKLQSRRFSLARVRRTLLYILLNFTKEKIEKFDEKGPLYARVLAFNERGQELLRKIKTNGKIPVVTKFSAYINGGKPKHCKMSEISDMLSFDAAATSLFSLCFREMPMNFSDNLISPKRIRPNTNEIVE